MLFTWLKLCYLPYQAFEESFLSWSGFWPCSWSVVNNSSGDCLSCPGVCTERERKNENLVHLCQYSLMEPTQLSAAGHRLGQENHPKCPLEVPVGFSSQSQKWGSSTGAPTSCCLQASSVRVGTSSILFSCMGVVKVFRGWQDQKSSCSWREKA